MKHFTQQTQFNREENVDALIKYLHKYWESNAPEKLRPFVELVFDTAFAEGEFSVEKHNVKYKDVYKYRDMRREFIDLKNGNECTDITFKFLDFFAYTKDKYHEQYSHLLYSKEFENKIGNLRTICSEKFGHDFLGSLKPKGFEEFKKNYNDYDGMEGLNERELIDEFDGYNQGEIFCRSHDLPIRLSLPHIVYDDTNQGRRPLAVLLNSIYVYSYTMHTLINEFDIYNSLRKVDLTAPYSENGEGIELPDSKIIKHMLEKMGINFGKAIFVDRNTIKISDEVALKEAKKKVNHKIALQKIESKWLSYAQKLLLNTKRDFKITDSGYRTKSDKFRFDVWTTTLSTKDGAKYRAVFNPAKKDFDISKMVEIECGTGLDLVK